MIRKQFYTLLLLTTIITSSMLTMPPPPAAAASYSCSDHFYNCKDPIDMQCTGGAYAARSKYVPLEAGLVRMIVRVDLMWSPKCQTNWARAYITSSNGSPPNLSVLLKTADDYTLPGTGFGAVGGAYGDMWYAPNLLVKACVYYNFGDKYADGCTETG